MDRSASGVVDQHVEIRHQRPGEFRDLAQVREVRDDRLQPQRLGTCR
jgi:hypothetical protein